MQLLQRGKIAKAKSEFFTIRKLAKIFSQLPEQHATAPLYNLTIVAILLAN